MTDTLQEVSTPLAELVREQAESIVSLQERVGLLTQERNVQAASLVRMNGLVTQWQDARAEAVRLHERDIATIGRTLIEQAESREGESSDGRWCDQYDRVISELNAHLSVELPLRRRQYTVTVPISVTISVTAGNEESAFDLADQVARDAERAIDFLASASADVSQQYDWSIEEDDDC